MLRVNSESSPAESEALDPLTPMSDQDRISPYNINQISEKNKEKY